MPKLEWEILVGRELQACAGGGPRRLPIPSSDNSRAAADRTQSALSMRAKIPRSTAAGAHRGRERGIVLLDQVNNRIVRFDPKNRAEPRILGLPEEHGADRSGRAQGRYPGLGRLGGALQTRSGGDVYRGLEEVSTRAADDQFAALGLRPDGLAGPGSDTDLLDANTRAARPAGSARARARQHCSRGAGSVIVDVIPDKGRNERAIEVRAKGETRRARPVAHAR